MKKSYFTIEIVLVGTFMPTVGNLNCFGLGYVLFTWIKTVLGCDHKLFAILVNTTVSYLVFVELDLVSLLRPKYTQYLQVKKAIHKHNY